MPVKVSDSVKHLRSGAFIAVAPHRNPGALAGQLYLPESLLIGGALVVVLHGCTQTGLDYADATGWLQLADRDGFAVLIPQQRRSNNANLCFNWFEPGDTTRGQGEAASIKAMIDWTVERHDVDAAQIFVTGLSAGAAMAGTMLATYPEVFAGGGLIAGLPFGVAASVPAALQQMRNGPRETASQLGERVRAASDHSGSWPRVAIFHGTADHTVSSTNGEATVAQWLAVHDMSGIAPVIETNAKFRKQSWRDASDVVQVEYVEIQRMGHGAPIDRSGAAGVGYLAPYVLDVGIGSSEYLVAFWGIAPAVKRSMLRTVDKPAAIPTRTAAPGLQPHSQLSHQPNAENGVAKVINDALRAAGLLK